MGKRIAIEEIKNRIFSIHGNIVSLIEDTYVEINKKAKFIDIDYGIWEVEVKSVLRGRGHAKRGYAKNTKNVEEIKKRLFELYGNTISIKENSYVNTQKIAEFIDIDFGIFFAIVNNVLRKKHYHPKRVELHIFKKYGVNNVTQNKEIAMKAARSQAFATLKYHWKTNEELVCQASWEPKVVDYLNQNRIDFQWQPKSFTMPNSKTYRPDLYLVKEDKWIEIKGYFRKDAKEKWDWFQSIMPNSGLWDKNKLKEMGIL